MSQLCRRWLRSILIVVLLSVGVLGMARTARAIEFDDDGIIGADEVINDDVVMSADTVTVDGTVNGDLLVSANKSTLNGTVNGNLIVTGAEVTVNGRVSGSLAFAGRTLTVNGTVEGTIYGAGSACSLGPSAAVGRNVLYAGFGLETQRGSTIGRDMVMAGYQALLAGQVDRDVTVEVSAFELSGSVGGDVTAKVDAPPEPGSEGWTQFMEEFLRGFGVPPMVDSGIRVAQEAHIGGALDYTSPVEQASAIHATPGGALTYHFAPQPGVKVQIDFGALLAQWLLARLREFITLLVLGGLAAWRLPALLNRLADQARTHLLRAAGSGLLVVIVGYVGAAILAVLILILWILLGIVTLGGLASTISGVGFSGLGLALALFSLAVVYGSKIVVAYLVGRGILRRLAPQHADRAIWPLILGVVIYLLIHVVSIFSPIPPVGCLFSVLGFLIELIVTTIGIGAMWLLFREWRTTRTAVVAA